MMLETYIKQWNVMKKCSLLCTTCINIDELQVIG